MRSVFGLCGIGSPKHLKRLFSGQAFLVVRIAFPVVSLSEVIYSVFPWSWLSPVPSAAVSAVLVIALVSAILVVAAISPVLIVVAIFPLAERNLDCDHGSLSEPWTGCGNASLMKIDKQSGD